jgi:hypothetical protein
VMTIIKSMTVKELKNSAAERANTSNSVRKDGFQFPKVLLYFISGDDQKGNRTNISPDLSFFFCRFANSNPTDSGGCFSISGGRKTAFVYGYRFTNCAPTKNCRAF